MIGMPCHRDIDGQPIDVMAAAALYEDFAGRTLGNDIVDTPDGPVTVRTVWSGIHEPEAGIHPFGTAISRQPGVWTEIGEYDTRQQAADGHATAVQALRADGIPPRPGR